MVCSLFGFADLFVVFVGCVVWVIACFEFGCSVTEFGFGVFSLFSILLVGGFVVCFV